MISGTFHISSQEWRYFSREKAIIHTAHLAQLPSGTSGETVLIDSTSPSSSNNNNFSVPPVSIPSFPGISVIENVTFSRTTLPDVFASIGQNKTILAQKNCIIQFAGWSAQLMQFYVTPNQSGRYFFYIEAQGDPRDAAYQGPIDPTLSPQPAYASYISCGVQKIPTGFSSNTIVGAGGSQQITMQGFFAPWGSPPQPYWSTTTYNLATQLTTRGWGIDIVSKNQTCVFSGNFLGNAPDAQLTGYMFKIADIP